MPAPSHEDLDRAIDQIAGEIVNVCTVRPNEVQIRIVPDAVSALSAAGAFLLAYRANIDARQDAADAREASR